MNYIESVKIEGFWGRKNVSLKFHHDLNFLIGENGSGKTTVINLISAVLRADIPLLYSLQFDKVMIKLKTVDSRKKPSIKVVKKTNPNTRIIELIYTIKEKASEKGTTYGVESLDERRLYRNDIKYPPSRWRRDVGSRLSGILSDLVEINWLSIHRTNAELERRNRREDAYESPMDYKLKDLSNQFSRFFSLLNSNAEKEVKNFQELVFLSLLDQKYPSETKTMRELQLMGKAEHEQSVVTVLKDLGVEDKKAKESVRSHSARKEEAVKKISNSIRLSYKDAISLSDAARVDGMIEKWQDFQIKRKDIFLPKTHFEDIINELFSGKKIHFNNRNEPELHLEGDEIIEIDALSSGEKQLFILLGETLLQEDRPVVFISDEPEISLHVKWQSELFRHIRSLNRSCQIISATHSPDIVGAFQERVIRIEECISDA